MKRFAKKNDSGNQKQEKVAETSDNSGSCTAFSISSVPVSTSALTPDREECPLSVKSLLKQKIQGKLSTVQEFDDSSCREQKQLEEWCGNLESFGFICELISLSKRHSPFLHKEKNSIPESALVVHASRDHKYSSKTGPFQLVRLVIFSDGFWRLQSTIYGFQDVTKGTPSSLGCEEVISLVLSWFSQFHTLCPGLIGLEDVEAKLGYIPRTVRKVAGPVNSLHSNSCKIWHVPSSQARKDDSDSFVFVGNASMHTAMFNGELMKRMIWM